MGGGPLLTRELMCSVLSSVLTQLSCNSQARRLRDKFGGADGLFGPFVRRVQSGGFAVQAAMLLLSHSAGRLAYLHRCLPCWWCW